MDERKKKQEMRIERKSKNISRCIFYMISTLSSFISFVCDLILARVGITLGPQ